MRLDRYMAQMERELFAELPVRPWWYPGKAGWRWRAIMAYRALRGQELGGFKEQ